MLLQIDMHGISPLSICPTHLVCKCQHLCARWHISGDRQIAPLSRHQLKQLLPQLALREARPLLIRQPAATSQGCYASVPSTPLHLT
jgi:hypothetical protein